MLAIAAVLEGDSRTDAARGAGMDRQTLRDWVHRYNAEGLAGLSDRRGPVGRKPRLSPEQVTELATWVRQGPDRSRDGVVRWRLADLVRRVREQFGVIFSEGGMGKLLRRVGFRHLVARPRHPERDAAAAASFRPGSPPS
jgi:transposase